MGAFNSRRTGKDRREAKRRTEYRKMQDMETDMPRRAERRIPGDRRDMKSAMTKIVF